MRIPTFGAAVLTYAVMSHPPAALAQVDQQRAQAYFKEARALCERDGGRLWGVSICAPMVIADMRTQTIATSQPAPEGARPRGLGIVNAPVQWGGTTWAAYTWNDGLGGARRRTAGRLRSRPAAAVSGTRLRSPVVRMSSWCLELPGAAE